MPDRGRFCTISPERPSPTWSPTSGTAHPGGPQAREQDMTKQLRKILTIVTALAVVAVAMGMVPVAPATSAGAAPADDGCTPEFGVIEREARRPEYHFKR